MPCSFCTLEPGTANMPPESEELPPTKAIFSNTAAEAPASREARAAARPEKPDPMITTS